MSGWDENDDAFEEHRKKMSGCQFMLSLIDSCNEYIEKDVSNTCMLETLSISKSLKALYQHCFSYNKSSQLLLPLYNLV